MKRIEVRLFLLLSCVLLMAFSCAHVRRISVDVQPKSIRAVTDAIAVHKQSYEAVLDVFKTWMAKYQLKKLDCQYWLSGEEPLREQSLDLCETYGFDYESRWLFGTERERIVISVFYDRKIGKTVIQLLEGGRPNQGKKSKDIEKELCDLLLKEFGKDAVQIVR